MQVKEVTIEYKMTDRFKLHAIGDEHIGTLYCDEDGLISRVKEIKNDPLSLWVGMGDKAEFITPHDPRWMSGVMPEWLHDDNIATDQQDRYCSIYDSIKSKCLGLLEGNHEDAIRIHNHDDVQKNICKNLEVDSLGYSCFLILTFKRKNSNETHRVKGFLTHGSGCAITKGAKLNRLQRIMDNFEADFYAHGHVHDIITDEKPYLGLDDKNRIRHKIKVGAMTGCWFRTYTQDVRASYGERKNYPPTTIGNPVFTIDPNTAMVSVTR